MYQNLSLVNSTLSSLKSCQADLLTGMDVVTSVAMDLTEDLDGEGNSGISEMEALMLECAKLDREIDCFVDTVQQATVEVTEQQQEALFTISSRVKKRFTEKIAQLSDTDLQTHQKIVAFKESIKSSRNRHTKILASQESENMEELDDELAVTQTQVIFTCPLTQADMVNPMKNKKCNHHYDENPIKILIETRRSQKKKCCCPVVGCGNKDVQESDLVPDHTLKRQIMDQKRQSNGT
ncbi:E3 SUMO-protein ligase NSE2 [Phyllopteryx taeniolatus]|uniref:E3 SUMO-protein ligase NSE2 n=1 Tax=Phyllopteryx taeniolatus TaxID=161469 RepID=UPI002AD557C8|nr:E3 SUMO-protein ligase NSE2 [Phyllopteryx taeniolatus]